MAARNRVTPRSEIVAIPARGLLMGNRGCLHRQGRIVRNHNGRRWIICETSFRDRHIEQWVEGRYTVLFFHDEAVALAAGHRLCAECRRERYDAYRAAWSTAFGGRPSAGDIDERLHGERLDGRTQRSTVMAWRELPRGAFAVADDVPVLALDDALLPWTADGYGAPLARPASGRATVLTPPATVAVLAAGYAPVLAIP
jgi:hypothetical protein